MCAHCDNCRLLPHSVCPNNIQMDLQIMCPETIWLEDKENLILITMRFLSSSSIKYGMDATRISEHDNCKQPGPVLITKSMSANSY